MDDNRFAMMSVNRSGDTSRSVHGDTAIQARSEGAGVTAAQGYADAQAWGLAGRSGARVRGHAANGFELGAHAGRGCASLASQAARAPSSTRGRGLEEAVEGAARRR